MYEIFQKLYSLIVGKKDSCGGSIRARYWVKDWTREDLEEAIAYLVMNRDFPNPSTNKDIDYWFRTYYILDKEYNRLEKLLKSDFKTDKDWNRALHMIDLESKNKKLKDEITILREKAEVFNKQLYATGLIVNCTGCDAGKPFDGENLTEEKVKMVEQLAGRLRVWFDNHKYRVEKKKEQV